jgi:ABC-type polysaccharide/polyol phosphate export permease
MEAFTGLLWSIATLLVVVVGMLSIVGATALRDRVMGYLVAVFVATALAPAAWHTVRRTFTEAVGSIPAPRVVVDVPIDLSTPVVAAVVLGHVVLGIVLLRRRFGAEARRRAFQERERARTRERVRVLPTGQEGER